MPLRVGLPYQPYSFLVIALDDRIIAQNAEGRVQFSGTDATAVIQSALDALISGRTWKELVRLKGQFTINTPIKIPSYTILDLTGAYLKVGDTFPHNGALRTKGTAQSFIDIFGGTIYGNREGQTGSGNSPDGILIDSSTDINIFGVTLHNFPYGESGAGYGYSRAINIFGYSKRVTVSNCQLYDNSYCDIMLETASRCTVINNKIQTMHRGIYTTAFLNKITNNHIELYGTLSTQEGIRLYGRYANYGRNIVAHNTLENLYIGINFVPIETPVEVGSKIRSNTIRNCTTAININNPERLSPTLAILDNDGYNPVGYISPDPTWGASPWTYTNKDFVPEEIYMSVTTAGDVSSITKDGQDLPVPGTTPTFICRLEPGESIVITYTTAGTLKRYGW